MRKDPREPAPIASSVEQPDFQQLARSVASGVVIVTSHDGDAPQGMTVTGLTLVTLGRPCVFVCLGRRTRTAHAVERSGVFGVNVLDAGDQELAEAFARRGGDHFSSAGEFSTVAGVPVLRTGLGYAICEVMQVYDGGGHAVVLGSVVECQFRGGAPLIRFGGRYARLGVPVNAAGT